MECIDEEQDLTLRFALFEISSYLYGIQLGVQLFRSHQRVASFDLIPGSEPSAFEPWDHWGTSHSDMASQGQNPLLESQG